MENILVNSVKETTNSYIIDDEGICKFAFTDNCLSTENNYRLYRFLTELEDTINEYDLDADIVNILLPKVRKLLTESEWIQFEYTLPDPELGWSVNTLYDEPDYPITVQMVTWLPGQVSPIHNHGTWGIVAIVSGTEKNTFWRQKQSTTRADKLIEYSSEQILTAGDIIGFTANTIHQVEVVGDEPVISFNIYGITDYDSRYEFDLQKQTATNF